MKSIGEQWAWCTYRLWVVRDIMKQSPVVRKTSQSWEVTGDVNVVHQLTAYSVGEQFISSSSMHSRHKTVLSSEDTKQKHSEAASSRVVGNRVWGKGMGSKAESWGLTCPWRTMASVGTSAHGNRYCLLWPTLGMHSCQSLVNFHRQPSARQQYRELLWKNRLLR